MGCRDRCDSPFPHVTCILLAGKTLCTIANKSAVRTCNFSYDGKRVVYTTDNTMGQSSSVCVMELDRLLQEGSVSQFAAGCAALIDAR